MGKQRPMHEVDPLALPRGTRVGPWRVLGFRGRGSYGTLYRVEREGREAEGSAALKLAVHPGDKRYARESWLLRHIHSPFVPQFLDEGAWEHSSGVYPFVVMELVEGEPLYEWAARRNPSERQVLGLLAQVARAIADTHAAGGLHRDVKGSNVLVRRGDGRGYLTDFGAGHYRGADTLTSKLLPPGTPVYRSPEAWGFLDVFRRHPTVHYPASTCDDLFALGVMAYRLVTDEYPPLTDPEERQVEPSSWGPLWGAEMAVALVGLLLAGLTIAALYRGPGAPGTASGSDGDRVAVGDSASAAVASVLAPVRTDGMPPAVGLPMPEKPFPGQRTPPCNKMGEVEIRKGCWFRVADASPPCKEKGKEDAYDWQGACYLPSYPPWRQPTSHPP